MFKYKSKVEVDLLYEHILWVQVLNQKMEIVYHNCNNRSPLYCPKKCTRQNQTAVLFMHIIAKNNSFTWMTKIPVSTFGPAKMEILKSRHKISNIAIRSHFCFSNIVKLSVFFQKPLMLGEKLAR